MSNDFHGASGPPPASASEPTLAERARTLMQTGGASSLSTLSKKQPGFPFGSVMPYACDEAGRPLFLISQMAMHTKNITADPKATLLVAEHSSSPLGAARISIIGQVARLRDDEKQAALPAYLAAHPDAQQWAAFGDFGLFRMDVVDVYFIGGFGVMGWITPEDYAAAKPDPLAAAASDIISHMNEDHVEAMLLLAKSELGAEATDARMTAVDQYGFNLALKTEQGMRGGRIAFPSSIQSPNDCRKAFVEMVKSARA